VWAYLYKGFEYGHGRAESKISALVHLLLQEEIAHNHIDETLKRLISYRALSKILAESLWWKNLKASDILNP